MNDLLDFLNDNAGALTVIFTAVVTFATTVYAVLTWKLVTETRLIRQAQTEPNLQIAARHLEFAVHILRLHVRNIGAGPAFHIRFRPRVVLGGEAAEQLIEEFSQTQFFKTGIEHLGPGEERVSNFTELTPVHDDKIASVIAFDLDYVGITGRQHRETLTVDMSEHQGTYQLGMPYLYSIALSLEQMQKDMARLADRLAQPVQPCTPSGSAPGN